MTVAAMMSKMAPVSVYLASVSAVVAFQAVIA
jgi:hypothetical protein